MLVFVICGDLYCGGYTFNMKYDIINLQNTFYSTDLALDSPKEVIL